MICISDFVAITVATNTSNLNYLQLIDSAKRHGLNYKVIFQALLARAIELKGTLAYRQKYLTLSLNKGQKKSKHGPRAFNGPSDPCWSILSPINPHTIMGLRGPLVRLWRGPKSENRAFLNFFPGLSWAIKSTF